MLVNSGILSGLVGYEDYRQALDYNTNLLKRFPSNFLLLFLKSLIKDRLGYTQQEVLDDYLHSLKAKSFKSVIAEDVKNILLSTNGDPTKMLISYTILGVSGDINGRILYQHLSKLTSKVETKLMKEIFPRISVTVQKDFEEISKKGIELVHWDPSSYLIYNEVCSLLANAISGKTGTRLCLNRNDLIKRVGLNSHKLFHTIPYSKKEADKCPFEEFNIISNKILILAKEQF